MEPGNPSFAAACVKPSVLESFKTFFAGGAEVSALFVSDAVQVTTDPPPLAVLLHWLIVTGRSELAVEGFTVHSTRSAAPPPLVDPLHWVIVAPVVLAGNGLQLRVGAGPAAPDPLHWLIVAAVTPVVEPPVRLVVTYTLQITLAPPPFAAKLHCSTEDTSEPYDVVAVVQVTAVLAGPRHSLRVTVEVATPVLTSRLLVTVTSQLIPKPGVLSMLLHWAIVSAAEAELPNGAKVNPDTAISSAATRTRTLFSGVTELLAPVRPA